MQLDLPVEANFGGPAKHLELTLTCIGVPLGVRGRLLPGVGWLSGVLRLALDRLGLLLATLGGYGGHFGLHSGTFGGYGGYFWPP